MGLNIKALDNIWRSIDAELIKKSEDKVVVYYKQVVAGSLNEYSDYYQNSLNYLEPNTVTGSGTISYASKEMTGEIFLHINEWDRRNKVEINETPVGRFQPEDVLFIGLASDVLKDPKNPEKGTYFDGCEYVDVVKTGYRYTVESVYPTGLREINSYYVLLRRSSKNQTSK